LDGVFWGDIWWVFFGKAVWERAIFGEVFFGKASVWGGI
jgi:hypothetical protein